MTNFIVYDLETHNTNRAKPYALSFYRLSKVSARYERDQLFEELNKCRKDAIVFEGDICFESALDFCLKLKGDERKVKKKVGENNLQFYAHNGSGFDTWIILINLSCDKHIVNIIKNGKSIIELKIINGCIENKERQTPQNLHL